MFCDYFYLNKMYLLVYMCPFLHLVNHVEPGDLVEGSTVIT